MGGFGSGFAQGFGLVSDFYKSQEEAALRREELDMDRAYREGLIADRAEQRKNEREAAERQEALLKTKADTAAVQADTESIRAKTAQLKAQNEKNKYNPDGSLKMTAVEKATLDLRENQLLETKETLRVRQKEAARLERERLESANAVTMSNIIRLSQDGSNVSAAQIEEIIEREKDDLFNPNANLNIRSILNPDSERYLMGINETLQNLASGKEIKDRLSPEALAGIGDTIGTDRAKYIGSVIKLDPALANKPNLSKHERKSKDFPNAPAHLVGGTIINSNVIDIQQKIVGSEIVNGVRQAGTGAVALNVTLANEVRMPDGKTYMYFPTLTAGRDGTQTAPLDILAEDGIKAIAGRRTMVEYVKSDPVLKEKAETQMKIDQFGTPQNYETAVRNEVNEILTILQDGRESDADATALGEDFDLDFKGMTVGQLIGEQRFIENEVRKKLLYGPSSIGYVDRAQTLTETLREQVPSYSIGTGNNISRGQSNRMRGPQSPGGGGTVQSLLNKEPTLNQLAKIDGFFENGVLEGADKKEREETYALLIKYLDDAALLKQTP
tara:strand:+ start:1052 stop:2722 length:1671 start_codon:yes stop_codon:yes gene_type:complete